MIAAREGVDQIATAPMNLDAGAATRAALPEEQPERIQIDAALVVANVEVPGRRLQAHDRARAVIVRRRTTRIPAVLHERDGMLGEEAARGRFDLIREVFRFDARPIELGERGPVRLPLVAGPDLMPEHHRMAKPEVPRAPERQERT